MNLVRDSFHQPNVGIEDNMPITIQEKHLLDLLEETVPYLRFVWEGPTWKRHSPKSKCACNSQDGGLRTVTTRCPTAAEHVRGP